MENDWGIYPVEYKVLIEPDEAEEVMGRDKLLVVPDHARDKMQVAKVKGTLVAVGGCAFRDPDWGEPKPKIGDKVYFAKYAGIRLKKESGKDEEGRYRWRHAVLCNDKDIAAVLDPNIETDTIDG